MNTEVDRRVTVVMYHFVRDLRNSRFPDIKGLSLEEFHGQIDYARRHYNPIGADDLLEALGSLDAPLPPRALLLTFDDGYRDHFENVLPVLARHGLTGCFFPPAKAVTQEEVLDVNKIHFVLATVPDKARLLASLLDLVDDAREEFSLPDRAHYLSEALPPSRFDPPDVVLIKRLLQRELPEALRGRIADALFARYVTSDEAAFSRELYMGIDELVAMREAGMHVGSHGFDHYWLDTLDQRSQEREVDLSLQFLRDLGCDVTKWVIGYPYGAYDDSLLGILRQKGCKAGFTTQVRIADADRDDPLTLPRIDTNDLPKKADAAPNEWTLKASGLDATG